MDPAGRVYAAIDRGVPDRVPVIPKIWVDLAAKLTNTRFEEVMEDPSLALSVVVEAGKAVGADAVRQWFLPPRRLIRLDGQLIEVDVRGQRIGVIDIEGGWATRLDRPSDFDFRDPYTMVYHQYRSSLDQPFIGSLEDAREIAVPKKDIFEEIGCGARQRSVFEKAGDSVAFLGDLTSATLAFLVIMRGLTRAMFDLVENPRLVHAVMAKGAESAIERGRFLIDLGHQVLRLNDSVANMSVISPESWREYIFPHMKDVCYDLHHYEPRVRIYCHICGNIMPILEDLVATGLDCIAPLDPMGGVDPAEVRRRVGSSVSLMGGVDTLSLLKNSPQEILEESKNCILAAGQQGGFLLGSGCVVPREAPEENLKAMREAAERFGLYTGGQLQDQDYSQ